VGWKKFHKKMKTFTDIDECNKILGDFIGANAQIWQFHITHKRLIIRMWWWSVDEHKVKNEMFIAALGCQHIVGAFQWGNADVSITKEINSEFSEPIYRIKDKNSDFELIADAGVGLMDSIE
jgi:hypothetical protein